MAAKRRSQRQTKGRHRKNHQQDVRAHWLQVGAVTVGLTAAVTAGQGVALAAPDDGGSTASASAGSDDSARATSTSQHAKSTNQGRKQPSRAASPAAGESDGATSSDATPRVRPDSRRPDRRLAQSNPDAAAGVTADDDTTAQRQGASTAGAARSKQRTVESSVTTAPKQTTVDVPAATDADVAGAHSVAERTSAPVSDTPNLTDPQPLQAISSPATPEAAAQPETVDSVITAAQSTLFDTGLPDSSPLAASALLVLAGAARRELDQLEETEPVADVLGTVQALAPLQAAAATCPATRHCEEAKLAYVTSPGWITGKVTGVVRATGRDWARVTYVATDGNWGTVKIDQFGRFTYTPDPDARHFAASETPIHFPEDYTTDTFTVYAVDSRGGQSAVDVTVDVKPANSKPRVHVTGVSNPDATTGVVTGIITTTDKDGDPLTFSRITTPSKGSVVVNTDGTFTYTPTAAARQAAKSIFARSDSFRVTVSDGYGGNTTVTVRVKVAPLPATTAAATVGLAAVTVADAAAGPDENRSPSARLAYVTSPGWLTGKVRGDVNTYDPDWDSVSYTATDPAKGTVTINRFGQFTYTASAAARHAAAAAGATEADKFDTFTVTVSDGNGGTDTVEVTVKIKPANSTPNARVTTVNNPVPATGVVTGTITATDKDTDTLSYTAGAARKGTVVMNQDGTFSYTPTAEARAAAKSIFARSDSFRVTISDGYGGTDTVTVRVKITPPPPNNAPGNATYTVSQPDANGKVTGTVTATDPDNDSLSYTGTGSTAKGSVTVNTDGTFSYTPTAVARHNAAASGAPATARTDSFTVTVSDGKGGTTTVNVNVDVSPHNNDPAITNATVNPPDANGKVIGSVTATDADNDTLSFTATTTDKGSVTINVASGAFTYTPTEQARQDVGDTPGSDTVTITVTDGHGGTDTQAITVTIAPIVDDNHAPVIGEDPFTATVDHTTGIVTGTVDVTDPDGDHLTYSLGAPMDPSLGTVVVDSETGSWAYQPSAAAQLHAWVTPGAQNAAFTIVASDGTATASVGVSAPVVAAANLDVDHETIDGIVNPFDIAVSADGHVYIISATPHVESNVIRVENNLVVVNPDGSLSDQILLSDSAQTSFSVAAGNDGRVYVADPLSQEIWVVNADTGTMTPFADVPGVTPLAMAVDPAGRLHVANAGGNTITVFNADGSPYGNPLTISGIVDVGSLAFGPNGQMFVMAQVSTGGGGAANRILAVNADGSTQTIAEYNDLAQSFPYRIAVDGDGRVYVTVVNYSDAGSALHVYAGADAAPISTDLGAGLSYGVAVGTDGRIYVPNGTFSNLTIITPSNLTSSAATAL